MSSEFVFEFWENRTQAGTAVALPLIHQATQADRNSRRDELRTDSSIAARGLKHVSRGRSAIRWGWLTVCLLLAGWLGFAALPGRSPIQATHTAELTVSSGSAGRAMPSLPTAGIESNAAQRRGRVLRTKPIEAIAVGDRVVAANPELAGEKVPEVVIDPRMTRLVVLHQTKPDGDELTVETLMPLEALLEKILEPLIPAVPSPVEPLPVGESLSLLDFGPLSDLSGAAVPSDAELASDAETDAEEFLQRALFGQSLELNLPELGAEGPATILAVRPCPPLEPDDGTGRRLVTSVFRHAAADVVDLETTGSNQPIGTTANHPFWSETRQMFVRAGQLEPGEHLRSARGTLLQVTRITPRRGPPVPVFNFEVDGQHVYSVGADGLLVHNNCSIILGLGEHLGEFRAMLTKSYSFKKLEMFPFLSLSKQTDDMWAGIYRSMDMSKFIHFNLKGIDQSRFVAWMRSGMFNVNPFPGCDFATNRELYECMSKTRFLSKTRFYDAFGSLVDAPLHWLTGGR